MSTSAAANPYKDRAQDFVSQTKEGIQDAAAATANVLGKAANTVKEYAATANEKTQEIAHHVYDQTKVVTQNAGDILSKYPISAVLAAFAVGYLTGRVCHK